jgi:hypothetical protein
LDDIAVKIRDRQRDYGARAATAFDKVNVDVEGVEKSLKTVRESIEKKLMDRDKVTDDIVNRLEVATNALQKPTADANLKLATLTGQQDIAKTLNTLITARNTHIAAKVTAAAVAKKDSNLNQYTNYVTQMDLNNVQDFVYRAQAIGGLAAGSPDDLDKLTGYVNRVTADMDKKGGYSAHEAATVKAQLKNWVAAATESIIGDIRANVQASGDVVEDSMWALLDHIGVHAVGGDIRGRSIDTAFTSMQPILTDHLIKQATKVGYFKGIEVAGAEFQTKEDAMAAGFATDKAQYVADREAQVRKLMADSEGMREGWNDDRNEARAAKTEVANIHAASMQDVKTQLANATVKNSILGGSYNYQAASSTDRMPNVSKKKRGRADFGTGAGAGS